MKKIYIDDNIFYIENFLSEKAHNSLIELCNTVKWDFEDGIVKQRGSFQLIDKKYYFIWEEYSRNIYDLFDPNKYISNYTQTLQNMSSGDNNVEFALGPHSDDDGYKEHKKIKDETPSIIFGTIYYINENYNGGELVYLNKNISIKPKSNMFVCHPGSKEYAHAVKQITLNNRYSIPGFILNK